ncbi:4-hydroxy-3-methylbut-2-en-1-yl diphosphate synthase [Roseibium polysiphoniae]|uniref:4-hydroxy-3-methylbut-2-en-1-yl diphosphate synthase n=1 Tax=Roseibium polysiphoniae TaxID=2571221 RepID=A0A944CG59_9HYPH|nr:4-hydroxy-3-methylbut-2-en-1-yl diphosphate synthase [Roseibium polysiphoniae]
MFVTLLERSLSLAMAHQGTLFRTGWAYILLLAALNFAIGSVLSPGAGFSTVSYMTEPVGEPNEGGLRLLAILANVLIGFSIAIAYVRRILIDARDFPLTVSKRTLSVIINQIVLSLIGVVALIPLGIVASIIAMFTGGLGFLLFLAAPFISLMVVQKLSVVLPAAAVDDPLTLKESWSATRGLGWPMAFSALIMSLLAGCLIGLWYLALTAVGALTAGDPILEQIRSAVFPMGSMLLSVWIFASLHATFYGLIRERFAARLGLTRQVYEQADTSRQSAREKAEKALASVNRINRR